MFSLLSARSCIFSMSDLARQVRTALDNHAQLAKRDPVAYYEWMHQSITDGHIEQINVVAGPIVGKVLNHGSNNSSEDCI